MKLLKVITLTIIVVIVAWYAIDFSRYSNFDEKKKIADVNGNTLVLSVLKVEPDASYMLSEVKVTDETKISGFGLKDLFVNNIEDLTPGQKVRVWYNTNADNENIVEKVVVYNLFNFN
ncbi:hypothetical protein [Mesobacillus selenatarsenatis]|uniref:DUF3221 domain-containing protein n=1 Tax=Mesobacillus selenatarsenatis TaxID=388741 RepID=A0A846TL29_9BACI|nr:hypothetical protein [Mesobacillus selenatarsenatis]NKE07680.1 hypothetical protein [Mesobacillus selenatarsenatis]